MSDEFLGLSQNVRKCQNKETFDNCGTRKFLDDLRRRCKCPAFNLIFALNDTVREAFNKKDKNVDFLIFLFKGFLKS